MHTRRHFIATITAALGGSVFAADGKPKTRAAILASDRVVYLTEWLKNGFKIIVRNPNAGIDHLH